MPEEKWYCESVFTVSRFFAPEECRRWIQLSEDVGYEDALVNTPQGTMRLANVRNNQRVMFRDDSMAALLWERAADFVPTEMEDRSAIGVNELMRFYRYDLGQQFNWHQDIAYERDNGERSYWTLMIYLNDDCTGGETSFEDSYSDESFESFQIQPQQGMALFFEHPVHHKGEPVAQGRKYVLRTDVMYAAEDDDPDDEHLDDEFD